MMPQPAPPDALLLFMLLILAMDMGERLANNALLWLWSAPVRDSLAPPFPLLSYRHRVAQL